MRVAGPSLAVLLFSGVAGAQATTTEGPAPASAPAAAPALASPKAPAPAIVRRDPKGVKGVSPYTEALLAGDAAYAAGDHAVAVAAYQRAVGLAPANPVGHLRLGEAQRAKENFDAARSAFEAARAAASADPVLRARAAFLLADLAERQKQYAAAAAGWDRYAEAVAEPAARGYPATAADRKRRIVDWTALVAACAEVKARIAKRLLELEDQAKSR